MTVKTAKRRISEAANQRISESANQRVSESANRCTCKLANLLAFVLFLVACTRTPTPTDTAVQFALVADDSSAPLIEELVAAYRADQPHVTVRVERAPNAERALAVLRAGQFDLASVSWLLEGEKVEDTLWYQPFARDAIVMVTHPTNPVGGLTLLQLRAIFQGQTLFWNELGGLALEVVPVSREDGSGARFGFESLVMGGRGVTPTAVVMPGSEAVVEYVSATPGAIGYVASGWLVPAVNLLAVEGVTPSPASVADGRYLLARPFYLVARVTPEDGVAGFVDWVKGSAGQEIVKRRYAPAP
jgi:phosphate transport system substrate-binding protein